MGSKIALILSIFFVSLFFLLGGDMISLQYIYSDLDAKGVTISYLISKTGRVDADYKADLENRFSVKIDIVNKETPRFGEYVDYFISKDFDPIIMSKDTMTIRVLRYAVIGYYG